MDTVGVRELRQNASVYLRRVAAGEHIAITDRGRIVAELRPPQEPGNLREVLTANGELVRGRGRRLPPPLPPRVGEQLSERLQRMRDEERW